MGDLLADLKALAKHSMLWSGISKELVTAASAGPNNLENAPTSVETDWTGLIPMDWQAKIQDFNDKYVTFAKDYFAALNHGVAEANKLADNTAQAVKKFAEQDHINAQELGF